MTWVLVSVIVLVALGMFAAGVTSGPWLRALPPLQGHHGHHVPVRETAAARYARLVAENGTSLLTSEQVTGHADTMFAASEPYLPPSPAGEHPYPPYVPAWLPAVRKPTEDHAPWTGSQPALDDEALAELDRVRYIRAQLDGCGDTATADDLRRVLDGLRTYGQAPVADVLAAQAAPPFPYDPDYDNCAGTPGCGSERVFYKWYGAEHTACPRCYVNVFGGEPDPSSVHRIAPVADVLEGERLAAVMQP